MKKFLFFLLILLLPFCTCLAQKLNPEDTFNKFMVYMEKKDWVNVYEAYDKQTQEQINFALAMSVSGDLYIRENFGQDLSGKDLFIKIAKDAETGKGSFSFIFDKSMHIVASTVKSKEAFLKILTNSGSQIIKMVLIDGVWKIHNDEDKKMQQLRKAWKAKDKEKFLKIMDEINR